MAANLARKHDCQWGKTTWRREKLSTASLAVDVETVASYIYSLELRRTINADNFAKFKRFWLKFAAPR
jgi:hypothetical protein